MFQEPTLTVPTLGFAYFSIFSSFFFLIGKRALKTAKPALETPKPAGTHAAKPPL